jgi:type IV pilus assembly protein PilE
MKNKRVCCSFAYGFSMVELMIVIAIVGILASVAVPMYREHVIDSRRSEARAAIEEIRNRQYEFFQNYKRYGTLSEINQPNTTPGGYYQLAVATSALRFSATATAINNQADDTECAVFSVTSVDTFVSYDLSSSQTFNCWK